MANAVKKSNTETKEVAPQTLGGAISTIEQKAAQIASTQEVIAKDVLIPRLLLMQGISPLVTTRKAQIGDMVRSTTGEKLGTPEQPLTVIPLKMESVWMHFETKESAGTTSPQFRGTIPRTAANSDLDPMETFKGPQGQDFKRNKAVILYALLPQDVEKYNAEIKRAEAAGEAPDLTRTILPVVITFQSTSFKHAGKKCASFFNTVRAQAQRVKGLAPFHYSLPLTCKEEQSGKNTWYVFDLGNPVALKDPAVREEAANWVNILAAGSVKADESGEIDETTTSPSSGGTGGEIEV